MAREQRSYLPLLRSRQEYFDLLNGYAVQRVRFWDVGDGGEISNRLEGTVLRISEQMAVVAVTGRAMLHQGAAEPVILEGNGTARTSWTRPILRLPRRSLTGLVPVRHSRCRSPLSGPTRRSPPALRRRSGASGKLAASVAADPMSRARPRRRDAP